MTYVPTEWQTGDIVTATKLNKLEQGVANAGGVLVVTPASESPYALDHTWQEIYDAGGAVMYSGFDEGDYYLMTVQRMIVSENGYYLYFYNFELGAGQPTVYVSNSADGYPTLELDDNT